MTDSPPKPRILVVDDIPDTVEMMCDWLQMHHYTPIGVTNSLKALEKAESEQPDLILLDVMMPNMDGIEVCRQLKLKTQTAHIPIILVTAKNPSDARAEGLLAGAVDYITKPVNLHDLIMRIETALSHFSSKSFIDVQRQLEEVAHSALAILNMEIVWVFSLDAHANLLRSRVLASTGGRRMEMDFLAIVGGGDQNPVMPLEIIDNPLCRAFLTRKMEVNLPTHQLNQHPSTKALYRATEMLRLNYLTIIPIMAMGKAVGVMVLGSILDHDLSSTHSRTSMTALASQTAIAMDYARLILDLTEREAEMEREQAFRQMILDTMSDGLAVIDSTGVIHFANQRLLRMLGHDKTFIEGRHISDIFHPEDRFSVTRGLLREGGATMKFDQRLMTANGNYVHVWLARSRARSEGMRNHQVIVLSDMTEQRQRQDELERQTNRLQALNRASHIITAHLTLEETLQNILSAVIDVVESQGASIFLADETSRSELVVVAAAGLGAERLLGMRVPIGEGIAGWVAREAQSQLVVDINRDPRFYRNVDEKTGMSTQSLIASPLTMGEDVIGVIEVINKLNNRRFNDDDVKLLESMAATAAISITNARLYESLDSRAHALENAYIELKEADKAKDEFIQNVSHELRTPLISVVGYSGLLEDGTFGEINTEQLEAVQLILQKAQHLNNIVSDILAVQSPTRTFDLQQVDLVQVVEQTISKFQPRVEEKNLALYKYIATDVPAVAGDSAALGEVCEKLLDNAVKFGAMGKSVEVLLEDTGGSMVKVSVRDHGIGIAPKEHEKIFRRFYQVDGGTTRRYGGVGLGLSIVKGIVEGHGGQITVDSSLGNGATFAFTVPKYALVEKVAHT